MVLPAALAREEPALEAYERLAPYYDAYTCTYDHERWLGAIEAIALRLGLAGRRLLDVACGTGKSLVPMVERGYEAVGCDLSPAMVERARRRLRGAARVLVADMRTLPALGEFDLVTCLGDALNYLLRGDELHAAFAGMALNARPGGLLVFDLNTLSTYRSEFTRELVVDSGEAFFRWRGHGPANGAPGTVASSTVDVYARRDAAPVASSRHVQRHHPSAEVASLLERCGFELLELRGQVDGARIELPADEERHRKLVYFARRSRARR